MTADYAWALECWREARAKYLNGRPPAMTHPAAWEGDRCRRHQVALGRPFAGRCRECFDGVRRNCPLYRADGSVREIYGRTYG